jgi:hypothetical protein
MGFACQHLKDHLLLLERTSSAPEGEDLQTSMNVSLLPNLGLVALLDGSDDG